MVKKPKKPLIDIAPDGTAVNPSGYSNFIADLKERIRSSQLQALSSINREMTILYWEIGKRIVEKQQKEKWGSRVMEKIAKDLQNEFPGVEGFSRTNLFRMKSFYLAYQTAPQGMVLEDLPV